MQKLFALREKKPLFVMDLICCRWVKAKKLWAVLFLFSIFSGTTRAAESLLDVHTQVEVEKSETSQDVREIALKKAIEETSLKFIEEVIGKEKLESSQSIIDAKILSNHRRYIPWVKIVSVELVKKSHKVNKDQVDEHNLEKQVDSKSRKFSDSSGASKGNGTPYLVDIEMKLAVSSLEQILLQNGLLYKATGTPKVLPLVQFVDEVNSKSYAWWSQPRGFKNDFSLQSDDENLKIWIENFSETLKKDFSEKGFLTLTPAKEDMEKLVPVELRRESLRTRDILTLAEKLGVALIVKGQIRVLSQSQLTKPYKIYIKLQALQATNGRIIGEVQRNIETLSGPFQYSVSQALLGEGQKVGEDLVLQVIDSWEKGIFGANLVILKIKSGLKHTQLYEFLDLLKSQFRSIKEVKEKLFRRGRYDFEVNTSLSAKQLANELKKSQFSKYKVEIDDVQGADLLIRVKN